MKHEKPMRVALIVAHPDDETLWAGGTILCHPEWNCFIVCLSRLTDPDRSARFYKALKILKSKGVMGDMDDGPDQFPLKGNEVEEEIIQLLPPTNYDLIITHDLSGEYTRHLRHEEVGKAILNLWKGNKIVTSELWTFAYEDGCKKYYPRVKRDATILQFLTKGIWLLKYSIIRDIYGFGKKSWEAETTPKTEAFWKFTDPEKVGRWLKQSKNQLL